MGTSIINYIIYYLSIESSVCVCKNKCRAINAGWLNTYLDKYIGSVVHRTAEGRCDIYEAVISPTAHSW